MYFISYVFTYRNRMSRACAICFMSPFTTVKYFNIFTKHNSIIFNSDLMIVHYIFV